MEDRSSRRMRTLVTHMARSTKGSNQRPDTLMQDRTSANSTKVLLQRTAGPYMWVKRVASTRSRCARHVRFTSDNDRLGASQRTGASCQQATSARLFDHLVGAGREPHWHVDTQRPGGLEIEHELELDGLDHGQLAWLIAS